MVKKPQYIIRRKEKSEMDGKNDKEKRKRKKKRKMKELSTLSHSIRARPRILSI